MARPFGQIIVHVDQPQAIEDMTGWFECFRKLLGDAKIEERWKRQPHMPSFIRDGRAAERTTQLAGQNSLMFVELAVVENQVAHACQNSDMMFVKYRCPLHRSAVKLLADPAMTYL